MSILVKFSKNFDFGQNFPRIPGKFRTISIFVKFSKNFYFGQNFENYVCGKIIEKKFDFWTKFYKIATNFDFSEIFDKFRFL